MERLLPESAHGLAAPAAEGSPGPSSCRGSAHSDSHSEHGSDAGEEFILELQRMMGRQLFRMAQQAQQGQREAGEGEVRERGRGQAWEAGRRSGSLGSVPRPFCWLGGAAAERWAAGLKGSDSQEGRYGSRSACNALEENGCRGGMDRQLAIPNHY